MASYWNRTDAKRERLEQSKREVLERGDWRLRDGTARLLPARRKARKPLPFGALPLPSGEPQTPMTWPEKPCEICGKVDTDIAYYATGTPSVIFRHRACEPAD